MTAKYDLTKLEGLVDGLSSKTITISPETMFLCLMALDDRAGYRGAWLDNDGEIDNNRWDIAQNLVDIARSELMTD